MIKMVTKKEYNELFPMSEKKESSTENLDELAKSAVKHDAEISQKEPSEAGKRSKKKAKKLKSPTSGMQIHVMKVIIHETINVYSKFKAESPVTVEPLYRIAYATLPNSNRKLTIFDKEFHLSKGFTEVALKFAPKTFKSKLEGSNEWENFGEIFITTFPFDVIEIISKLNWKNFISYFVDDTGHKSEIITEIAKAHLVSCKEQDLNNHMICLTNSGSGKSTTYERITGESPSNDVSEAGMFGSIEQSDKGYKGIQGNLSGEGIAVFDEFPEVKYSIVNRMLNYLESGKTVRKLVVEVHCEGTKSVIFLGNYTNLNERDFVTSIVGLATEKDLERVGRRFGHIIFDELAQVPKRKGVDYDKTTTDRLIVKYALELAEPKIVKIFKRYRDWMGTENMQYEQDVAEVSKVCKDPRIRSFLKGCAIQTPRLRCAGLKRAIIENLDQILMGEKFEDVCTKLIEPDMNRFYEQFKNYNLNSFYNLRYDKVMFLKKNYHEGMTTDEMKELALRTGISVATAYRWLKIAEKEYNPWRGDKVETEAKEGEGDWKKDIKT